MSKTDKILSAIESLDEIERNKLLKKIRDKYMNDNVILLNHNHNWWDKNEDDIYNK